jgi:nitrite reductase (NADH) small subunit
MVSESWVEICKLDDLIINDGVNSLVGDQQIAIFRTDEDDKVYAIGNYDPIGKAYVLSRGIVGDIKGEPVVASPLYKQHFNLLTGQCLEDDDIRVPAYPVKVIDGMIQIQIKK